MKHWKKGGDTEFSLEGPLGQQTAEAHYAPLPAPEVCSLRAGLCYQTPWDSLPSDLTASASSGAKHQKEMKSQTLGSFFCGKQNLLWQEGITKLFPRERFPGLTKPGVFFRLWSENSSLSPPRLSSRSSHKMDAQLNATALLEDLGYGANQITSDTSYL